MMILNRFSFILAKKKTQKNKKKNLVHFQIYLKNLIPIEFKIDAVLVSHTNQETIAQLQI